MCALRVAAAQFLWAGIDIGDRADDTSGTATATTRPAEGGCQPVSARARLEKLVEKTAVRTEVNTAQKGPPRGAAGASCRTDSPLERQVLVRTGKPPISDIVLQHRARVDAGNAALRADAALLSSTS